MPNERRVQPRVRLLLDETLRSHTKCARRSWFQVPNASQTIGDLQDAIRLHFGFARGLRFSLKMHSFVLPCMQPITLLRDDDIVDVCMKVKQIHEAGAPNQASHQRLNSSNKRQKRNTQVAQTQIPSCGGSTGPSSLPCISTLADESNEKAKDPSEDSSESSTSESESHSSAIDGTAGKVSPPQVSAPAETHAPHSAPAGLSGRGRGRGRMPMLEQASPLPSARPRKCQELTSPNSARAHEGCSVGCGQSSSGARRSSTDGADASSVCTESQVVSIPACTSHKPIDPWAEEGDRNGMQAGNGGYGIPWDEDDAIGVMRADESSWRSIRGDRAHRSESASERAKRLREEEVKTPASSPASMLALANRHGNKALM